MDMTGHSYMHSQMQQKKKKGTNQSVLGYQYNNPVSRKFATKKEKN